MRTDVGSWRGGQLVAKPRTSDIPDPLDPEWQEQVYIRNLGGAVKPVQKWLAYDMIQNHRATEATEEEYYEYEQQYWNQPQKVKPSIIQQKSVEASKDKVMESLGELNQKFDKLTDAVLQLAQKSQSTNQAIPQPKKRGRPSKRRKYGVNR